MTGMTKLSTAAATAACVLFATSVGNAQSTPEASPATATATAAATATVTWAEFSGYKRYGGNCLQCHGPDGMGSSFAPNLTESLKAIDHEKFTETVVNGRVNGEYVMPAFGADPNVMCYLDDIHAYLKARSEGRIGRGRPVAGMKKPADVAEAETACMGA